MLKANAEIRKTAKESNVSLWQIAKKLGCSEQTFLRWMRDELPEEQKQEIYDIIEKLMKEDQ